MTKSRVRMRERKPRTVRKEEKERLRHLIIKAISEYPDGARVEEIFRRIKPQDPKIGKRRIQRRIRELVKDGTLEESGYYVYSVPYGTRLLDSLFGGHAFLNLWSIIGEHQRQQQRRKELGLAQEELPNLQHLVEIFGVYMLFCFLRAAYPYESIRSYEDRIDLLRSMIPLKYDMYYKFIELLRGKPFEALSGFENRDKDTLGVDEKIIAKWYQRLKEQYPTLVKPLESSAEIARDIVKQNKVK